VTERATRAELRSLGVELDSSALARAAVDLARRLDAGPGDRAAAMLCRELRLVMGDLHRRHPEDLSGEVENFLERIAAPNVVDAAD
jgi:predicted ATPase